jgi:hypothetical protein
MAIGKAVLVRCCCNSFPTGRSSRNARFPPLGASRLQMSHGSLRTEERTWPSSSFSSLRQKSVSRSSPPPILRPRSTKNVFSTLMQAPLRFGSATSMVQYPFLLVRIISDLPLRYSVRHSPLRFPNLPCGSALAQETDFRAGNSQGTIKIPACSMNVNALSFKIVKCCGAEAWILFPEIRLLSSVNAHLTR